MTIDQQTRITAADREIADIAYDLWVAKGFWGWPPERAFMAAMLMVRGREPGKMFLVPSVYRKPMRRLRTPYKRKPSPVGPDPCDPDGLIA